MPILYVKERHDIGILRTDGTTKVGLMLATDKNGIPKYQMFAKKKLADQYFTGVPDYGYQDPEEEVPVSQDDWRSGLGLEIADKNDSKRYHKSTMDMRFRGKGLCGPKATAATLPTMPTILNATLETWASATDLTSWTETLDNGTVNREATTIHGGTYSCRINKSGAGTTSVDQDVTGWSNNFRSTRMIIKAWCYSANASVHEFVVSDGVGTATSGTHSGGSSWEQLTATIDIDAAATKINIKLQNDGASGQTVYWDDVTITVLGVINSFAEFNDLLYFSSGQCLMKVNASGTILFVRDMAATITSLCSFADSRLYIALGVSTTYWYMSTAEAFTESTAVVKTFKYFTMVNAATPVLWGNDSINTIRSNTNPINGGAAWSGQTTVDTSYYDITKLLSRSGACYIMKENRPYYLNSSGAVQSDLASELEALKKSTDNGKNAIVWLNNLYMPWGEQALLEEDAGTNTWRNPSLFATDAAEYNEEIFAVAGDDQYLYAILDYSTKVEVLAGRLETIDSSTKWVWHCICEITLTGCETAFISAVYQKRLWISSTSSGDSLYYIPLPVGYADVVNDANRDFLTGTTLETSWLHGNFQLTTKAFPELTLVMGHTYDAAKYFTVKYKKLGDSSWTTIGNYTGSATSMTQTRYIPADGSSNNPKSTLFKLQFTAVTDSVTVTPILLTYLLKGVLYPGQRDIIACAVKCSNEIVLKDGTIDKGSRDYIVTTINEAREATWPVTIYDIDGTTQTVKFLPVSPLFTVTKVEKGRIIESEYNFLMQKVSLS